MGGGAREGKGLEPGNSEEGPCDVETVFCFVIVFNMCSGRVGLVLFYM